MMRILVIEHDNGIKGQEGFSDEISLTEADDKRIIEGYIKSGCTVYRWYTYTE